MKDALAAITTLEGRVTTLLARVAELESDLSKARSAAANTGARGAIKDALRNTGPARSRGDLISKAHAEHPGVAARAKQRADEEDAFQKKVAKVRAKS